MESRPPQPLVLTGFDEVRAAVSVLVSLPAAFAMGALVRLSVGSILAVVLGTAMIVLLAGARYRLSISVEGIELVELSGWVVPVKRRRYPLDASIERYQSLEADEPEGLCIEPKSGWGLRASDCFGPHFDPERLSRVHRAASEALVRCRTARPSTPQPPRFGVHPALDDALEGPDLWPSGRLRQAKLTRDLDVGGVRLPEGTRIEANAEGYLDPSTADRLRAATLSAPTRLPLREAPVAQAGCRLHFDASGRCLSAVGIGADARTLQGMVLDGARAIAWDARGGLTEFTLGAALRVGTCELAKGSTFRVWLPTFFGRTPSTWYVRLTAPIELPQLAVSPSMTVLVAGDFSRLLAVMPNEDTTIDGVTLRGGILHWPLDDGLRIDVRACRKMGLVRP